VVPASLLYANTDHVTLLESAHARTVEPVTLLESAHALLDRSDQTEHAFHSRSHAETTNHVTLLESAHQ